MIVLMETPQSALKAFEIASASSRIKALLFGCEDFLTDMKGSHGPDGRSLMVPRHLISMAARANGLVPIDTPYVKVKDLDGLRDHITQARELGFEGMLVMSPGQIEIAREMYTPSKDEVEKASKMVELADQAGTSIAVSGNVFISPPTLKRSRSVLKRSEDIAEFTKFTETP